VLFFSYSRKDAEARDRLAKHLRTGTARGALKEEYDRLFPLGLRWKPVLRSKLGRADIILLLISPDFLLSSWCEFETKIALEQQALGKARVIPVLLTPVVKVPDEIAELQMVPARDTPMSSSDRKIPEEALVAVARQIAEVVEELRYAPPPGNGSAAEAVARDVAGGGQVTRVDTATSFPPIVVPQPSERRRLRWWSVAGVGVICAVAGGGYLVFRPGPRVDGPSTPEVASAQPAAIARARRFLNVGRPRQAAGLVRESKAALAHPEGAWLLAVADAWLSPDKSSFETSVTSLLQERSADPHALFLRGLELDTPEPEEAEKHYRRALRGAPDLAEAHFALGTLLERRPGAAKQACEAYQQAVQQARAVPRYRNNLALCLANTGALAQAAAHYEANLAQKYILSAVELAKVRWKENQPDQAVESLDRALEWLGDSQVPNFEENLDPWSLPARWPNGRYQVVDLESAPLRTCYTRLLRLITTTWSAGKVSGSDTMKLPAACETRVRQLGAVLRVDRARWLPREAAGHIPRMERALRAAHPALVSP
jgi:tetratricopeptide (TPR) repeat protein